MPATRASDPDSSNNGLNSLAFDLPPFENATQVIQVQMGLYTWNLRPLREGFARHFILICTQCGYMTNDTTGDDDESEIRQYFAQLRSSLTLSVRGFYENQKCSYPTMYGVTKDYLSMIVMSAPSESLFSRVKSIVTDNRNKLDATTVRILAILKARSLFRDELSIIADSFQDVQVSRDANQDILVADDATAFGFA